MKATRKLSSMQEASERAQEARAHLKGLNATLMECTHDHQTGVLWERWLLPNFRNVYLFATSDAWDLSVTASLSEKSEDTLSAVSRWAVS